MKKPNTSKERKEKKESTFKVDSFDVSRAKCWDNGGVTFDLEVNGMKIYGCRVSEGKNGDFISFPSRKGTDGKYYNYVYIPFQEEDQKTILEAVEVAINGWKQLGTGLYEDKEGLLAIPENVADELPFF